MNEQNHVRFRGVMPLPASIVTRSLHLLEPIRTACIWFLVMVLVVVGGGCKPKAEAPAPVSAETPSAASSASTAPAAGEAAPVSDLPQVTVTPTGEPDLRDLNRYLLRWAIGHQRRPASFEEFAKDPGVQIPVAPAGKKYVLDRTMHIVLVNQ